MVSDMSGIRRVVNCVDCVECPRCHTCYDRALLISEIKKQSPFIFDFAGWTTKFVCQVCDAHVVISSAD